VCEILLDRRIHDNLAWAVITGQVRQERTRLQPWPALRDAWFEGDRRFVRTAYRLLLNREADPKGLAHFLGELRGGLARLEVVRQLVNSPEAAYWDLDISWWPEFAALDILAGLRHAWPLPDDAFIACAYHLLLGREVDPNGLEHHGRRLRQGMTRIAFIEHLAESGEAHARRVGTNWLAELPQIALETALRRVWELPDEEFIEALFRLLLNRGADPNGAEHHRRILRSGGPRVEVLRQFLAGPEAAGRYGSLDWLAAWEAEAMAEVLARPDDEAFLCGAYWLVRRRKPRRRELAVQVPLLRWLPFYRRRHVLRRLRAACPPAQAKEAA
jgi:Domain of unknown function (DUF4214)